MKDVHKIPDLIKSYFFERLKHIDYERMFEDWFVSVDNACTQLGYGYIFRYNNVFIGLSHLIGVFLILVLKKSINKQN